MNEPTSHKITPSYCPVCSTRLDGATGVNGSEAPKPGDVTVCAYCASPLTWTEDMQLRGMTAADISALDKPTREGLMGAIAAVRASNPAD